MENKFTYKGGLQVQSLIDWVISCLEVRELHTLYTYIYIFCLVSYDFCTQLYDIKYSYVRQTICIQIYLTDRWDPNKYYHSWPRWTGE